MTITTEQVEQCAQIVHEVNRAYCQSIGDYSQMPWEMAPDWVKDSVYAGIGKRVARPTMSDKEGHEAWWDFKCKDGWKYGPVKDAEAKTHPNMIPYEALPKEQQTKDVLFRAVVENFFGTKPCYYDDSAELAESK